MDCCGAEISLRRGQLEVAEGLLGWLSSQLLCFLSLGAASLPEAQSPFHISADPILCVSPTYLNNVIAGILIHRFSSEEDCPQKCPQSLWLGLKVYRFGEANSDLYVDQL